MSDAAIGCHLSIRGGYAAAAKSAFYMHLRAYQYFPKNPQSLAVKAFDARDAEACAAFCRERGVVSVAHTPYPTNLAADDEPLRLATVQSLRNDLAIADACGSLGVVVHFGKSKQVDPLQGYRNIIQCVNEALAGYEGRAMLLIENQAGEGSRMGTTLEELVHIRRLCDQPERIGFCFDTCHAFASGLWTGDNTDELLAKGDSLGYWEALRVVHVNDSRYDSGSGRDRHAMLGHGFIGEQRLLALLRTAPVRRLPWVLETPAGPDGTNKNEIEWLRQRL